jgi:hypothetical protein
MHHVMTSLGLVSFIHRKFLRPYQPSLAYPLPAGTPSKVHAEDVISTTLGIYRGDIEKCALSQHSLPLWMPDAGVNDHLRAQISSLKIPALNFMPSLLLHELGEWPEVLKGPVETVFHLRNSTYVIPSCDAGVSLFTLLSSQHSYQHVWVWENTNST